MNEQMKELVEKAKAFLFATNRGSFATGYMRSAEELAQLIEKIEQTPT